MPTSLIESIELKRLELVNLGVKYGFSSEKTIKTSQELDRLLNTFEKTKNYH